MLCKLPLTISVHSKDGELRQIWSPTSSLGVVRQRISAVTGDWVSRTDGNLLWGHMQQAFWPSVSVPDKTWSVTHLWLVCQVLDMESLFSLNFSWSLPARFL